MFAYITEKTACSSHGWWELVQNLRSLSSIYSDLKAWHVDHLSVAYTYFSKLCLFHASGSYRSVSLQIAGIHSFLSSNKCNSVCQA